ncbi:DNA polymerase III subunit delta [Nitrincola sp. A-D6]|uniref:DNA polymerase III subunit delta' n=1 Tax=Nitrincola sp. A-D6 TaxID=1545442 RepID=UPI00051FBB91|nr:DNA polymerase III subunit delta' [Nitrincola sp. A-D6]KGK42263.1 DNA polymerase III subunit delta [Nitrincola sp. A-D6]
MSYQPLVVPWADALWNKLARQHAESRLPHAILLTGHTGTGKIEFAQAFAHLLLCHQPHNHQPCGVCRGCELLSSGNHPDLVHLHPAEAGKAIKVDQVRELLQFLHNTAQQGGYRVVVMEPAENMNINAANALLKSLEEPGNNTLLLLVSHQPGQLMPTIRSRCQQVGFPMPKPEEAIPWLTQQLDIDAERAEQLLRITQGAPLKARLLYQNDRISFRAGFMTGLVDLLKARTTAVTLAEKFYKEDLLQLLEWMHSLLVDIARLQADGDMQKISNTDMFKMLNAVAKKTTVVKLYALIDKLQAERISLMERHNPNRQLLLETLLLEWVGLVR